MDYYILPIVMALVASTNAGPTRLHVADSTRTSCSSTCTGSTKLRYAVGNSYQYNYEAQTETMMFGASEDKSTIGLNVLVEIEVESKCEMVLKIRDTSIFAHDTRKFADQDPTKEFSIELEKFPIRFSFQDGVVDSVCPHADDKTWAVNIKRGILSAFQNSMDNFERDYKGVESDVSGQCDTEYTVIQRGWRILNIKKTKDMSSCSHRQGFESAIQTAPFRLSSGLKSLPILKSSQSCDQEVSTDGTVTSAICHEIHLFQPFSQDKRGAMTEVTQKLIFKQQVTTPVSRYPVEGSEPQSIYYEHSPETDVAEFSAREGMDKLRDLCDSLTNDVSPATTRDFSHFVAILKKTDAAGLNRVYNQGTKNSFCRKNGEKISKFVMDAIPMVGTDASIELMKTLVSSNQITRDQAEMWLASLAFINHPTQNMIKHLQELTNMKTLELKILLPLSALVRSYCRQNPQCHDVQEVKDFMQILQGNIAGGCRVNQQNFRQVMLTLRALGNTGVNEQITRSLYDCMLQEDNSMDIRVAAIQALRRMDCSADRSRLMSLYRNSEADSELRIAAYLVMMKCPNPEIIYEVKETLAEEETNQVGSFVWTHLTNLMESSDPENRYVQSLLNNAIFDKQFDLDKLKFSRNYEASFYLDSMNTGAKIDSDLIWSTKSFVPRSAALNLSVDLFGERMNLLEIGARVEGLETLLESYFGPRGYFNKDDRDTNEIPEADPKHARLSDKKFDSIKKQVTYTKDQLRGALYMRMFGTEMSYNMFGASNGIDDSKLNLDMFNFLKKARNNEPQDLSLTKNFVFIDSTYTIPTIVGLPLKLSVNGTASLALNIGGKMDAKNPRGLVLIEGNFEPSGSVEVDSMMGIDAVVTKGGLKMLSTLYSSTGAKGMIKIENGQVLDVSFDLTKEKSEVVTVKNSFYIVYNTEHQEETMVTKDRYESSKCTGNTFTKITGVEFCTSLSFPNTKLEGPRFPFTGPVEISIAMSKQDLPEGYKFEGRLIKTPAMSLIRLMSDTPKSINDRAIGLDITMVHQDKTITANLISPWKKANLQGQLYDSATMKGLTGILDVNAGDRIYKLDAKINVDRNNNRMTFTPVISLEVPEWKTIEVSGKIDLLVKKQFESFESEMNINGLTTEPIKMQGKVMNTNKQVGVGISLNYEKGQSYEFTAMSDRKIEHLKLRSRYHFQPVVYIRTPKEELMLLNATILHIGGKSFKLDGKLQKITNVPFAFNVDVQKVDITKKNRVKLQVRARLTGPKLTTRLMVNYDNRADKNIITKVRTDYNILRKYKDVLTGYLQVKPSMYKNSQTVRVKGNIDSRTNNNLDATMTANFKKTRFGTNLDVSTKYGSNLRDKSTTDRLDIKLDADHRESGQNKNHNYTLSIKLPAKKLDVKIKGGNVIASRTVDSDIEIQYHPDRKVAFGIRYHNRTQQFNNHYGALTIHLPEGREMSFAGAFGRENENKYTSNLEFEVIKGRRTRIDTLFKLVTGLIYEFEIGVALPDLEPVRVIGAYNNLNNGHSVEASFSKANKVYRTFGEMIYEPGQTYKCLVDVAVPERRVKLMLGSSIVGTETHVVADCQWDANNNLDDRVLANVTYDFKGLDDFEMASTFHYPSRTINFNLKHNSAARYITNIELKWSPKDKIELNIIFRDDHFIGAERTELEVGFKSPFKKYEEIGLSSSVLRFPNQVQTKSSVTWQPGQKFLVSSTVKIPFTINSVDFSGSISTPWKDYSALSTVVTHRFSNGQLNSNASAQWGRNRLSIGTNGKLAMNRIKRTFKGDIEIHTPFEGMRMFSFSTDHEDNYKTFSTKFTIETSKYNRPNNDEKYTLEIDMDHNEDLGLSNTANIRIRMPDDDIRAEWEVSMLMGSSRAMIDIKPRRGNRFMLELAETHSLLPTGNKITSQFELHIPTEAVRELLLTFTHEDRQGYVATSTSLTKDNLQLLSADVNYVNSHSSLKLNSLITSAYTEDIVLNLVSAHSIMPYNTDFELRWGNTPWKVTADLSLFYDQFGHHDTSLVVYTPIPSIQVLTVAFKREKVGLNWKSTTSLSYAQQNMKMITLYRYDHVKYSQVKIETNFRQFPGLTTSIRLDGNVNNFNGDADFKMSPYVQKITTDFRWSFYEGSTISGSYNLKTPFPQYPYLKAQFDSNPLGMSQVSNFELEYLPKHKILVELDHRFTSLETLEGTIKVTSPFTKNKSIVAGFTHIGNSEEFKTNAKVECECIRRPVYIDSSYSSKNGILSTLNVDSPFRGYETVKWNLNHKPKQSGYETVASYETNGKKISYENEFKLKKDSFKWQMTLHTPFGNVTKTHLLLGHSGTLPNTKTQVEMAYNDQSYTTDVSLKQQGDESALIVHSTTPLPKYRTINAQISKSGTITDFTMVGDLDYGRKWHSTLGHKYNNEGILTSVLLQCPYLKDDVSMTLNYTGEPLDSHLTLDYNMGVYNSVYNARLLYSLPNVIASSNFTTRVQDDIRVNIVALKHLQKLSPDVEMNSQLLFQNKNVSRVNLDFLFKYVPGKTAGTFDITYHTIAELPHANFTYNKVTYESKQTNEETRFKHIIKKGYIFTIETPLLEKYFEEASSTYDLKNHEYDVKSKVTYGDKEWTSDTHYEDGYYIYKFTTPYEGYEKNSLEIKYNYPKEGLPTIINSDITITSSALETPVTITTKHENEFFGDSLASMSGTVEVRYPTRKDMTLVYTYAPGSITGNLQTDIDGYEQSELDLQYTETNANVNIKSSAMSQPIIYSGVYKTESWTDFEVSSKFLSGFRNFTHLEFVLRNTIGARLYKPKMMVKYEDKAQKMKEMSLEGNWAWHVQDSNNMKLATGMYMKTPYKAFNELSFRLAHEHSMAPLTVTEGITLGFNDNKYLDTDATFGAENRFSGEVVFHSPRPMEYRFSVLNEGESVDASMVLNWNKADRDSNFKIEFGLADAGNKVHEKKNFMMKIINPGRNVSMSNKYENNRGSIKSVGTFTWDVQKKKEVSYEFGTSLSNSGMRNIDVTVNAPARTVEVNTMYSQDTSNIYGFAEVLWDAKVDRSRRVEVKFEVSPKALQKKAGLNVRLPSFKKEFTLSQNMIVNDGPKIMEGETKFSYSPDVDKTVSLHYFIINPGTQWPNYQAGVTLHHEATNTRCEMSSSLLRNNQVTVGNMKLSYLENGGKEVSSLRANGRLDTDKRQMVINLVTPKQTAGLTADVTQTSPYVVTVATTRNNQPTWKSEWNINTNTQKLTAMMTYDGMSKEVWTTAYMPNNSAIMTETETLGTPTRQQGMITGTLENRKLHAHIKWRPELIKEITDYGVQVLNGASSEFSPIVSEGIKDFTSNLLIKHRAISVNLQEELAPISQSYEVEIESIQQDLRNMRRELKRMHKDNEMYLQTMENMYTTTAQSVLNGYTEARIKLEVAYIKTNEAIQMVMDKMEEYKISTMYNEMMQEVRQAVKELEKSIAEEAQVTLTKMMADIEKLSEIYDEALIELSAQIKLYLEALLEELVFTPYVEYLDTVHKKLVESAPDFTDLDQTQIYQLLSDVKQLINDTVSQSTFIEKYTLVYEGTHRIVGEHFGGLLENTDVKELHSALLDLYDQASWLYKYTQSNMSVKEFMEMMMKKARARVMEEFDVLPLGLLDMHKSSLKTFDLQNGEIEFVLYLPIPVDNFDELAQFTAQKYINKVQKTVDKYFPRRDFCIWDLYYQLPHVRWSVKKDWVPPFNAFGTVSGKQHFTTFDGHHYYLSGLCSYVLAQDLENNNFTVSLKYTGGSRNLETQSIITMVDGKTVELFDTYMVKVDGQPTELPYRADPLTIHRSNDHVVLESKSGLTVMSDFTRDYHLVSVSGYYFGKVGGLLGNFDYEPNNDMMKPNGDVEGRLRKLLNAWEVDNACRSTQMYIDDKVSKESMQCEATFDASSSSLRPCFLMVEPSAYRRSCDIVPESLCKIAALYRETCRKHYIDVNLPDSCVTCGTEDGKVIGLDETLRYEKSKNSLPPQDASDIIVVVEEQECNLDLSKQLRSVISKLEEMLGTSDNRYGLVGYGDHGLDMHTMEGKLFNTADKFAMGLENMKFDMRAGYYANPMEALKYATEAPFRPGVQKIIILASCSPCNLNTGVSYSQLEATMEEKDITLHLLRETAINTKSMKSSRSRIYGIDNTKVISGSTGRKEKDLFDEIHTPDDYCASLALHTNGSVFDSSHLMVGSLRHNKDFMQSFGERLNQQQDSQCQVCSCELNSYSNPQTVCRSCDWQPFTFKPIDYATNKLAEYKNSLQHTIKAVLY